MKKITIILLVAVLVATAWFLGRNDGIRHAIEDSTIFTVDVYNPECPEESYWYGYDQQIFIVLDGNLFEHGMYQG